MLVACPSGSARCRRAPRSVFPGPLQRPERSELADEAVCRFDDEIARQLDRLSSESADRLHNLQQISRIAGPRAAATVVVALVQIIDPLGAMDHAKPLDHGDEDAFIDLARRGVDADLVADAAQ